MKFGKLANVDHVDFDLPPVNQANLSLLKEVGNTTETSSFYYGGTGYSWKEYVGSLYPPKTKTANFLHHYSRQFNTIEHNSTHYRLPSEDTVQKWLAETPADFRFCPKVLQAISHRNDLGIASGLLQSFTEALLPMNHKIGVCFAQMPPYFDTSRLPKLELWLKNWPFEIPLSIELRDESWFADRARWQATLDLLQAHNVSTVITDVAGRRDVLHNTLSTSTAVIRFVGNGLHRTDYQRIDAWVQRLKLWYEAGLRETYFFLHEPEPQEGVELAYYLEKQLKVHLPDVQQRGPKPILPESERGQMSLF